MKIWTILLRTRNLCTPQEQLPDFLSATTAAKRISSTKISTCLSDLRWHYYQNAEYISCDSCDTKTHFHQRKSWRLGILVASASERSTFGSNYELTIYQYHSQLGHRLSFGVCGVNHLEHTFGRLSASAAAKRLAESVSP